MSATSPIGRDSSRFIVTSSLDLNPGSTGKVTDMNARHTEPVQTGDPLPVPNHHASHPGFSGVSGLFAAIGFLSAVTTRLDWRSTLPNFDQAIGSSMSGAGPASPFSVRRRS